MDVISLLLSIIFIFLSGLHFYWALFGVKDPTAVLPSGTDGTLKLKPGKVGTSIIALLLAFFALIYLNPFLEIISFSGLHYISVAIGILFLVRAVGDFKYLGFFKSIKQTHFAKMDSRYYAPLALTVSVLIFILELWR
ncbi:DUF3995 domain-containing protein [Allomuricauda sp. NBRC 101325]|uniref:DUF3995 domain-containing protein n=1 Tax=Allomuricauda sp. NBRC 101325 TaxID=1113758 RepID=UPI0024A4340C|nr:DUF3995 domain-containing protein [Muricauda sp. NBRC 101325]GLU44132.1 membrane protein [Muricauda sp. NBRC 101325]